MFNLFNMLFRFWLNIQSYFKLNHHHLSFIFYIFLLKLLEDIERFSNVDQKNLILSFAYYWLKVMLHHFSNDSCRLCFDCYQLLWLFVQSEDEIYFWCLCSIYIYYMNNAVVQQIQYILTVVYQFSFQEDSQVFDDMRDSLCYELFERFVGYEGIYNQRKGVFFVASEKDCDFLQALSQVNTLFTERNFHLDIIISSDYFYLWSLKIKSIINVYRIVQRQFLFAICKCIYS